MSTSFLTLQTPAYHLPTSFRKQAKHYNRVIGYLFLLALVVSIQAYGQPVREYVVKRAVSPILIDGRLSEKSWQAAAATERFVFYLDGKAPRLSTTAKLLWDDTCLYIGFICEDPDVWATMTKRDDRLWKENAVEVFCDPDGDGQNYVELQVNPLGTVMDALLSKPYSQHGSANFKWDFVNLKAGAWVDGTINDTTTADVQWTCEIAIPFKELAPLAPSMHFPPQNGDVWRLLLGRYDRQRTGLRIVEVSSWVQTDTRGFHAPDKYGRIIFSSEPAR